MSYYDHATMMAHRLGPWADARVGQPTSFERELLPNQDMKAACSTSKGPGLFGRMWLRMRRPPASLSHCDESL